jgi:hypothetical protein
MNRSKLFDPFDPNNRDRRKRRTKAQIAAEQAAWNENIDGAFRVALHDLNDPSYAQGDFLLEVAAQHHDNYYALRRNITPSMERIGYVVLPNEKSSDKRWKAFGKSITVYRKVDAPVLDRADLARELEW